MIKHIPAIARICFFFDLLPFNIIQEMVHLPPHAHVDHCVPHQEPAKSVRGGRPRTVPYPKLSAKGHIELQMIASRIKNCVEPAGDLCFV